MYIVEAPVCYEYYTKSINIILFSSENIFWYKSHRDGWTLRMPGPHGQQVACIPPPPGGRLRFFLVQKSCPICGWSCSWCLALLLLLCFGFDFRFDFANLNLAVLAHQSPTKFLVSQDLVNQGRVACHGVPTTPLPPPEQTSRSRCITWQSNVLPFDATSRVMHTRRKTRKVH